MNYKTPISALQELMAARKKPLPLYIEEGCATSFQCTVQADGVIAVGHSTTKKGAKHNSAQKALELLGQNEKMVIPIAASTLQTEKVAFRNYVGELNELVSKKGLHNPTYEFVTCTIKGEFIMTCSFSDTVKSGFGMNKKDAKQDAARNMLKTFDAIPDSSFTPVKIQQYQDNVNNEKIINLFKSLSLSSSSPLRKAEIVRPLPTTRLTDVDLTTVEEDTLDELKEKVNQLGFEYNISKLQHEPCIICVQTKISNHCFLGLGKNRDYALKKALKGFLQAWKIGVDFTDKISFGSNL